MKTRPYSELAALSAESYLEPSNFVTEFDVKLPNQEYAEKKYNEGLEVGEQYDKVVINESSVWFAMMYGGGVLSSSEGIGYHRNTKELLQGFLDSGVEIVVKRFHDGKFTETVIQENTKDLKNKKSNKMKM